MKRFKINLGFIAFILGAVIAFTQSSFTTVKAEKVKRSGTNYVFNGNSLTDDTNAANYSVESGDPGCDQTPTLPCVINVPAGQTLSGWLSTRSDTQIRDQATEKKSIQ